jgi:hypothetical protein
VGLREDMRNVLLERPLVQVEEVQAHALVQPLEPEVLVEVLLKCLELRLLDRMMRLVPMICNMVLNNLHRPSSLKPLQPRLLPIPHLQLHAEVTL